MVFNDTILKRFWNKVDRKKENDCWNWKASKIKDGYGRVGINSKLFLAHRISWMIHNGNIKEGLCVCHKCDNPSCVNPKHLFLGTHTDNMRDMFGKGRNSHIGEKNSRSKLTEKDVKKIRKLRKNDPLLSYSNIGKLFGVTGEMVGYIIRKQNWSFI